MTQCLIDYFKEQEVEYIESFNFSKVSSIGIGGRAGLAVMPSGIEKLISVIDFLSDTGIKFKIIGRATNTLMLEDFYDGVIILTKKLARYFMAENNLVAECGTPFSRAIHDASVFGFGGAEALYGIPGSVGGMVYGNAGAYGASISDFFVSGEFYAISERRVVRLENCDMNFSYRESLMKHRDIVLLKSEFALKEGRFDEIRAKLAEAISRRTLTQPYGQMSLGSVFKRNGDIPVSKLIDELGLKGLSVGGASVSKKHAGFIINSGGAAASDLVELVGIIKARVFDAYGIKIEEEIEYF